MLRSLLRAAIAPFPLDLISADPRAVHSLEVEQGHGPVLGLTDVHCPMLSSQMLEPARKYRSELSH